MKYGIYQLKSISTEYDLVITNTREKEQTFIDYLLYIVQAQSQVLNTHYIKSTQQFCKLWHTYPHFTDGNTEGQRGLATGPRLHIQ